MISEFKWTELQKATIACVANDVYNYHCSLITACDVQV